MSNDRKALIRLASSLPKGSDERRTLLAELKKESRRVTLQEMRDFIEIAQDNDSMPTSTERRWWFKHEDASLCPVCGSRNTGVEWGSDDQRGYKCYNCGSEYSLRIKVVPTKLEKIEYNRRNGQLKEQPVKGSMMYEDITYND